MPYVVGMGWATSPESGRASCSRGDGTNKGSLTVDGEARMTNRALPPFADLHLTIYFWARSKLIFDHAKTCSSFNISTLFWNVEYIHSHK